MITERGGTQNWVIVALSGVKIGRERPQGDLKESYSERKKMSTAKKKSRQRQLNKNKKLLFLDFFPSFL